MTYWIITCHLRDFGVFFTPCAQPVEPELCVAVHHGMTLPAHDVQDIVCLVYFTIDAV